VGVRSFVSYSVAPEFASFFRPGSVRDFLSFSAVQSISSGNFPLLNAVRSCTLYSEYTKEISSWKNFHTNKADSAKLAK